MQTFKHEADPVKSSIPSSHSRRGGGQFRPAHPNRTLHSTGGHHPAHSTAPHAGASSHHSTHPTAHRPAAAAHHTTPHHRVAHQSTVTPVVLPEGTKLRIAVIGGLEEVGRNCTMIEYGDDIIIIDLGLQFPEEDMPGIDYIIPNMSYFKGKEKNIRGVIITHGHYDHIGAIPHVMGHLGYPPIYALPITVAIIKRRQEDYPDVRPLTLKVAGINDKIQMGKLLVEFIHINHNIPDSVGVVIKTPEGTVVHTGDWKFDYQPTGEEPADLQRIAKIGSEGVLALLSDSTNASQPGHQISETEIATNLEDLLRKAPGRVIVGTFASLLSRIKHIIEIAEKMGKVIAIGGYSMKTNVEIAKELGYMKFNPKTIVDLKGIERYPADKVVIVCTGAQGEKNASLMRIANGEHRDVQLTPGDTVVFSSSVVPGNERTVQRLKDTLFRKGAEVINYQMMDVHAGGHAKAEDVKLMVRLLNPKYFVPIHGNHYLLHYNARVAISVGVPKDRTFIADNGQIMEFKNGEGVLTKTKVPSDYVFVDGLGVSDETNVVVRDRQVLAEDGMVVIIATVDTKTGVLIQNPDIISRGFVFLKSHKELIDELRARVKKIITDSDPLSWADTNFIRNKIREYVGQFLFTKTEKRPMILPVVIEV